MITELSLHHGQLADAWLVRSMASCTGRLWAWISVRAMDASVFSVPGTSRWWPAWEPHSCL